MHAQRKKSLPENSLITSLKDIQKPRPRNGNGSLMIGEKPEPDRIESLPLADMIKNALRGKNPVFTMKAGSGFDKFGEYDQLVESIDKAVPVPGKSVILLVTKPLNGSGEPERYMLSKVPPEKLTDDPSLMDIGCNGDGHIKVNTEAYTYFIAKVKAKNGKNVAKKVDERNEEPEEEIDVALEITGDVELDLIGDFLLHLDRNEINSIVMQAQFKSDRTIAKEVVEEKIKTEKDSRLPYLEVKTEEGKTYNIYLIEEKNIAGRKVWDDVQSEVTSEYPHPGCYDECVKVDTGQQRYAVYVVK